MSFCFSGSNPFLSVYCASRHVSSSPFWFPRSLLVDLFGASSTTSQIVVLNNSDTASDVSARCTKGNAECTPCYGALKLAVLVSALATNTEVQNPNLASVKLLCAASITHGFLESQSFHCSTNLKCEERKYEDYRWRRIRLVNHKSIVLEHCKCLYLLFKVATGSFKSCRQVDLI